MDGSVSGSFLRLQTGCWLGLQSPEGLTEAGAPVLRWLTHVSRNIRFLLAIGRRS